MVLMVVGMEGHTLPWPTPPAASPLRMGVGTTMLILLCIPTAHGGIVATSSLHLLLHHYWHIHIPIRWPPCYPWAPARLWG